MSKCAQPRPVCAALPDCGRSSTKRGYCEGHYQQFMQGRLFAPLRVLTRQRGAQCAYPPCDLAAVKRGYCGGHYQQMRAGRELAPLLDMGRTVHVGCDFPECPFPHEARGYCSGHVRQLREARPLVALQLLRTGCAFTYDNVACDRPHEAHGYCEVHYKQFRRGEPLRPLATTPSPIRFIEGEWRVTLFGLKDGVRGIEVGYAVVSEEDRETVAPFRWNRTDGGYARSGVTVQYPRGILLHVLLLTPPPDCEGDHINGVRWDNRRENLRIVTHAQNMQNRGVQRISRVGIRGVSFDPKKRLYRGHVRVGGKIHNTRRFKSKEAAAAAASAVRTTLMPYTNEARAQQVTHAAPKADPVSSTSALDAFLARLRD